MYVYAMQKKFMDLNNCIELRVLEIGPLQNLGRGEFTTLNTHIHPFDFMYVEEP